MDLFDCLHVIVTFLNGKKSIQFDMCIGKPDFSSEEHFLTDLTRKINKVHNTKELPIIKLSCCYYGPEVNHLPGWFLQSGKWTGEEILEIFGDSSF